MSSATKTRPENDLAEHLVDLCFSGKLHPHLWYNEERANDTFRACVELVDDCLTEVINAPTRGEAIAVVARIRKSLHQADEENRNG